MSDVLTGPLAPLAPLSPVGGGYQGGNPFAYVDQVSRLGGMPTMTVRPDPADLPALPDLSAPAAPDASTADSSAGTQGDDKSGSVFSPSTWFSALAGFLTPLASRFALILLAVLLILGAMYLFAAREGVIPTVSGKPA